MTAKPAAPDRLKPSHALLLGLLVFFLFSGTTGNGFINLDDNEYVYENPWVRQGITADTLGWALTSVGYYYWQPVTWISHMLDIEFFGLKPGGHHFTNALLHSINAVLLLLALYRLTGRPAPSVTAAALFAVHPLRVESVAWIAERKDLLAGTFFIAGIAAYANYARRPSRSRYAVMLGAYLLALASKPTAITFPFVLLLLDYWPLARLRFLWPVIREKLPLFALGAGSAILTFIGQKQAGAVVGEQELSLGLRLANVPVSYVKYAAKFLVPYPLAVYYPYDKAMPAWQPIAAIILLAAITLWFWRVRAAARYLVTGWLWFLGVMVPMAGVVQVGLQAYADRFTYLPMIGLSIAAVWFWGDAFDRGGRARQAAGVILIVLAALSWIQTGYWKDSLTLLSHTLKVAPQSPLIENNLGSALLNQQRGEEAMPHFQQAVRLAPRYGDAWLNLGIVYSRKRDLPAARRAFAEAVRFQPNAAKPRLLSGMAAMEDGDEDAALDHYKEALRHPIAPADAAATHNDIGMILARRGRVPEAIEHFRSAVELNQGLAAAHRNLVQALIDMNEPDQAIRHLHYAIAVTKGDPELRKLLDSLQASR